MKHYAEIKNGIIIGSGAIDVEELPNHCVEITVDMYNKITNLPANFINDDNDRIIDIIPSPKPQEPPKAPTETELLKQETADQAFQLMLLEYEQTNLKQTVSDLEFSLMMGGVI